MALKMIKIIQLRFRFLRNRQLKMPFKTETTDIKQLPSLKNMCLESVAKHLNFLCESLLNHMTLLLRIDFLIGASIDAVIGFCFDAQ